jgi:hypothetical protein
MYLLVDQHLKNTRPKGVFSLSQLNQNSFHSILSAPVRKTRELMWVNLAISRIYTRKVDLVDKLEGRRLIGIMITAVHLEGINSVFVNALHGIVSLCVCMQGWVTYVGRTKDCAIPV